MSGQLIIAVPSKGRLKEQVEGWLADCGAPLQVSGGSRGYVASLKGVPGAQVRLLSAGDIAEALDAGEVHLGVTGEDLLRERGGDIESRVMLLRPPDAKELVPLIFLVRLSRGKMLGVDHNKGQNWVGGSVGIWRR